MSTRCSVGLFDGYHLYRDVSDYQLWLSDNKDRLLCLMPEETWEKIRMQIIADWLKEVCNDSQWTGIESWAIQWFRPKQEKRLSV
jgi:hypothetical protein